VQFSVVQAHVDSHLIVLGFVVKKQGFKVPKGGVTNEAIVLQVFVMNDEGMIKETFEIVKVLLLRTIVADKILSL